MPPKFSVLISVYDREIPSRLGESLNSIVVQSLKPDEVILVKDGPLSEGLNQVIDNFCEEHPGLLHVIQLQMNYGLGRALKVGLKSCSHDIIARMDSDDLCDYRRFEKQIGFLEQNPGVGVVGSWIAEIRDDPNFIARIRQVPSHHRNIVKNARFRNPLNHMTVVFRKKEVMRADSYNQCIFFEDYWLWMRMLQLGIKMSNISEVLVYVRSNADFYQRRGGLRYTKAELAFLYNLLRFKFISVPEFIVNLGIRVPVRLMPNSIRTIIYDYLLRKKDIGRAYNHSARSRVSDLEI